MKRIAMCLFAGAMVFLGYEFNPWFHDTMSPFVALIKPYLPKDNAAVAMAKDMTVRAQGTIEKTVHQSVEIDASALRKAQVAKKAVEEQGEKAYNTIQELDAAK